LDRPDTITPQAVAEVAGYPPSPVQTRVASDSEGFNGEDDGELTEGKAIYIVSDGTGWTAEHAVSAALGQFEHCLVDRGCPMSTHLFSGVRFGLFIECSEFCSFFLLKNNFSDCC